MRARRRAASGLACSGREGAEVAKRDYYETLGIARTANDAEIKTAFRKLAMKHHPDRNPGDKDCEHKFKELNEAYEVLKDGDKRAAYDRFGHAAFEQGGGGGRERGNDVRYTMEISLEEAFAGKAAQVRMPTSVTCEVCSGSGAKGGAKPKTCPTCAGHGKVRQTQGFFTLERTCPACHGRGQVIDDPCPSCAGSGRVQRERTLSVNIPSGVEDGTRIRLAGEGDAGARG